MFYFKSIFNNWTHNNIKEIYIYYSYLIEPGQTDLNLLRILLLLNILIIILSSFIWYGIVFKLNFWKSLVFLIKKGCFKNCEAVISFEG